MTKIFYSMTCISFIDDMHFFGFIFNTYIIGHYNPSVRIIDLVFHTTYVVCVNFIHKWRDLQFKVDSKRQNFEKLSMAIFIYSQKSAERKSPKKYFSYFVLMSMKPTHYLLDHGDYITCISLVDDLHFLFDDLHFVYR